MISKKWPRFFISTIALLISLPAAQAETISSFDELIKSPRATDYVLSRPQGEEMIRQAIAIDKKLGLHVNCKSDYKSKLKLVIVNKPMDFVDGKSNPVAGEWQSNFMFERCGETKIYNVIFTANPLGNAPSSRPYLPGVTLASNLLLKDAFPVVITAARMKLGEMECDDVQIFDMRLSDLSAANYADGKSLKGSWSEVWTFKICGQLAEIPITFTHNEKTGGTDFMANAGIPKGLQ